jgi:hypothetical protein
MKFGNKTSRSDKAKMVEKRLGATTKGTAEAAKPSTKIRPTGGLKPNGIKITRKW